MAKLSFTYGVMGSSKSAQALITRYNYINKGFSVLLIKPDIDNRDDDEKRVIKSRIGISAECLVFNKNVNLITLFKENYDKTKKNLLIVDEVQFCTKKQIEQLKALSSLIDVKCYGLKTNFKSELFEGSKRLLEIADNFDEIEYVCRCGKPAIINARIVNGKVITFGNEIQIGGDEKYEPLCYKCWKMLK